jgi:hypothetical protein
MNIIEKKVKAIIRWIKNDYPVKTIITGSWVFAKCPYKVIRQLDNEYATISLEEMTKILQDDWTHDLPFNPQTFDCNAYAISLKARLQEMGFNSVGLADGQQLDNGKLIDHWFNVWFDDKQNWYIIEPQDGLITLANRPVINNKGYKINWIII